VHLDVPYWFERDSFEALSSALTYILFHLLITPCKKALLIEFDMNSLLVATGGIAPLWPLGRMHDYQ